MKTRKQGFTLVELMVVAIIVAILAATSIAIMSGQRGRAIATEAESTCGTIKTALRIHYAEHKTYPIAAAGTSATNIVGILANDLNGTYFNTPCYTFRADATSFDITVDGNDSTTPNAASTRNILIQLDEQGNWTRTGI